MSDRTLLLAGNWKMNHDHLEAISSVQKLAWALEDAKLDGTQCDVVVIPPFTDIRSVQTLIQGDKLWLTYGHRTSPSTNQALTPERSPLRSCPASAAPTS